MVFHKQCQHHTHHQYTYLFPKDPNTTSSHLPPPIKLCESILSLCYLWIFVNTLLCIVYVPVSPINERNLSVFIPFLLISWSMIAFSSFYVTTNCLILFFELHSIPLWYVINKNPILYYIYIYITFLNHSSVVGRLGLYSYFGLSAIMNKGTYIL